MHYYLSLDAGTTSFKAAIYNENWQRVAWETATYALHTPQADIVEYYTEGYWRLFCAVVSGAIGKSGISASDIVSICIDSQGETLICLDEEGKPLRNAIVWLDNRSQKQAAELQQLIGNDQAYRVTGQPEIVSTWPATKIRWLKENEPDIFQKTAKFLMLEDYLIYRLTGEFAGEKSLNTSTLYMDITRGVWWDDMLSMLEIKKSQLPELMDSGIAVGKVTIDAAKAAGLAVGTPVVTGALDQAAAMVGAGNYSPGVITETTGTALAVCATVEGMLFPEREVGLTMQAHCIPGMYFWLMWSPAAGLVLEWFKNSFYDILNNDNASLLELINAEARSAPPGCDGLIMLPHLCGAGTPEYNPTAKGVFYGISTRHTRGHFARAVMESVGYMLKKDVELMRRGGMTPTEIRSLGGGAKSALWNGIKSDMTGLDIVTLSDPETTNLGAAIIGAAGVGVYNSIAEASRSAARQNERYSPNEKNAQVYNEAFDNYNTLYHSLTGLFAKTSS